jgi:uncharacterized protein
MKQKSASKSLSAPLPAVGHAVDLFRFVADGAQAQGECSVAALPRLAAESLNLDAQVAWHAQGQRQTVPHQLQENGAPVLRDVLLLRAQTQLMRRCDRCGQPVALPLAVNARLQVFASDADADEAPLEDDWADPVVGSTKFSLLQQVEEELLLAIAPFVMHQDCKIAQEDTSVSKSSPFSKLAALKTGLGTKK